MHCSSDAFDTELLLSCMEKIKQGKAAKIPNYDFKSHKSIEPGRVVLQIIYYFLLAVVLCNAILTNSFLMLQLVHNIASSLIIRLGSIV